MTAALWYLTTRTLRNRTMSMLRRVKQPRYAIGMVFVIAYFGFMAWGQLTGFGGKPRTSTFQSETARVVIPAVIALILISNWFGTSALSTLAFTQAEIAMLFPAPVTRRALILLKVARAQLPILLNVVIMMVLWASQAAAVSRWFTALGLYAVFVTIYLHRLGAALVFSSTFKHGRAGLKRNWVSYVIGALVMATVFVAIMSSGPGGGAGDSPLDAFIARVTGVLSTPLVRTILLPIAILTAPVFAQTTGEWAVAFGGALAIAVLHLWWVLRSHAAFEEAAAEQSARLHEMLESFRKRGTMAPQEMTTKARMTFPLRPLGHPAIAILWKNSLVFFRTVSLPIWLLVLAMPAIVGLLFNEKGQGAFAAAGAIAVVLAVMLLLAGGMSVRNDLRGDLLNLSFLKTIPLRGTAIVFAEAASSALPLAVLQCILLWMAIGAALLSNKPPPTGTALAAAIMIPVAVAGLNLLASIVRNAVAVLFPAWTRLGAEAGPGGFEVMGQAMLGIAAMMIGLILLLIAPALVTFIVVAFIKPPATVALVTSVLVGTAAMVGESYLVTLWIGRVLERTEPSASLTAS